MYNCVLIKYKNGFQIRRYDFPIKEGDDISNNDSFDNLSEEEENAFQENNFSVESSVHSDYVSLNRSKQKIYYYSRSCDWSGGFFVTLTFNPDIINSFSYKDCLKCVRIFLDSLKRYDCTVKYLFVPELHKSGRYHFHGLITKCNLINDNIIKYSGHNIGSDKIYNFCKFWQYGFSTVSMIKESKAVEKYIAKYTTKDLLVKTKYQHRYLVSKNIECADILKIDYPFDNILQLLYSEDLVDHCNTDGNYNRVTFIEVKNSEKVLHLFNEYVIHK